MLVALFCLSLFSPTASASPTHVLNTPGGSACLAVLLTLFLLLSSLFIAKRIYLKTRKSEKPSQSLVADFSLRSSASILPSMDRGSARIALLVGFFGSPTWETSVTNLVDKPRCPEYKQSSLSYQLRYGSRGSRYSGTPSSSLNDKGFDHAQLSVSTFGDIRARYEISDTTGLGIQRKTRSLGLPTRPSRACTRSTASRRFSMPSMRRRDISASYQKRTSSLKSSTTKGSDLSSSSFPGNSSLRLVESRNDPDDPLPLSPKQSKYRMSNLPNTFAPLGSLSRHDHMTGIPPLPPLPVFRSTSAQQEHAIDTLKISQPYALTAGSNISIPFANKSASRIGRYASHLASGMKVEQQDRSNARKPLSPVLGSNNSSAPSVSYPSAVYSTLSPKPHLESQTISPKVKQKTRRTSIRIRRSPAIGPSPLRAMILPDPSDASITIRNSVSQMGSRNLNTALDYSRLGFGFSSTPHTGMFEFNNAVAPAQEQAKDRNKRASRLKEDEDDPNLLIGIIQELVEETSQWDKSLFKDKNFKTMIENSKHPSFRANQMPGKVVDKECLRRGDGIPEDESAEFDLSLLGLDIFRSDGETFIPSTEDKKQPGDAEGTDMVSFWDEKTWDDQEAKRAAVGVAC